MIYVRQKKVFNLSLKCISENCKIYQLQILNRSISNVELPSSPILYYIKVFLKAVV